MQTNKLAEEKVKLLSQEISHLNKDKNQLSASLTENSEVIQSLQKEV